MRFKFVVGLAIGTILFCAELSLSQDLASAGSMTLGNALKLIQDRMNAEGPLAYFQYHYSDRIGIKTSIVQSNFVADQASCKIRFHSVETTQAVLTMPVGDTTPRTTESDRLIDLKPATYAISSESVSVMDEEQKLHEYYTQLHHPETPAHVRPSVWVVRVRMDQDRYSELYVHDQETADVLGKALQRAIQLCNHTSNEPF